MISTRRHARGGAASRLGRIALGIALGFGLGACDSPLEVDDPTIVTEDQLQGPDAVPVVLNGIVGDFHEAFDDFVRYTSLFTDEMILAGTFPTRIDVDERDVQQDPDNTTLTTDLYTPLQVSRASADRGIELFSEAVGDPEFEEVEGLVLEGLALSYLHAGYVRAFFSELYCAAVLEEEGAPVGPDATMEAALGLFRQAQGAAADAGLDDVATAALVGEARALLWLGRYDEAAAAAAGVPADFVYVSEYSSNSPAQANEIFAFSTGTVEALRWTVGDGTAGNRHNEIWSYFDEWLDKGLLVEDPPGLRAAEIGIPVTLQTLYDGQGSPIVLASGWEAQMIIAEAELRAGATAAAESRVNALLSDPGANPMTQVNPGLGLDPFQPVSFTGDLTNDLPQLARARSAGLWLTGERQATSRRFLADGVDLYPEGTRGSDTSFPIPQQEIDNNPNVSSGCG